MEVSRMVSVAIGLVQCTGKYYENPENRVGGVVRLRRKGSEST